ncbi:MAG: efflux RND transporter periplasmic adaptor subunit [Brumimicrobium sp.]
MNKNLKQKIGLFGFLLILISLIFFIALYLKAIQNEDHVTSPKDVLNLMRVEYNASEKPLTLDGVIISQREEKVKMDASGKIEDNNPSLEVGKTFKKGDILIKLERIDILYKILEERTLFKKLIIESLPKIEQSSPSTLNKWKEYSTSISRLELIPEIPEISKEEESIISHLGIDLHYYKIKQIELEAEKYFYTAPFDGKISQSFVSKGSKVSKNQKLLQIIPENSLTVTSLIASKDQQYFGENQLVYFTSEKGDTISKGNFIGLVDSTTRFDTLTAQFSIEKQDLFLAYQKVIIHLQSDDTENKERNIQKGVAIPNSAIIDNHVYLLENEQVFKVAVTPIDRSDDSTIINNLPSPSFVITNPQAISQ